MDLLIFEVFVIFIIYNFYGVKGFVILWGEFDFFKLFFLKDLFIGLYIYKVDLCLKF